MPNPGQLGWIDLTVPDAPAVRDFYSAVIGWDAHPVDLGGYADFTMMPSGGSEPAAGICHARGENAHLPPVWIPYFIVENLSRSLASCADRGGTPIGEVRTMGDSRYAVVRDPAGAVCALYQP